MTPKTSLAWKEILTGEALLLNLMGKIITNYPNKSNKIWYQSLIDEKVFDDVPFAPEQRDVIKGLHFLQSWTQDGLSNENFIEMQKEYTRLFIGPKKIIVSQWESTYFNEDRLIFQEQTIAVRAWYLRFNLIPDKINKEPDDHIGLEMIFTAHLVQLAIQALEKQDKASFEELIQAQKSFLSEHLLRWAPAWCNLTEENAGTDFYRGIAYVTHGALTKIESIYKLDGSGNITQ